MKAILISILAVLMSTSLYAQEQTLFSGEIDHGGYGGPAVKFAPINGDWEVLVGGRGGWIINHTLVLGGAGYGMATQNELRNPYIGLPVIPDIPPRRFEMGYGGFLIEFIINSNDIMHFSVESLIGGGGITEPYPDTFGWPNSDYYDYSNDDAFFIFEPGANLMLNVTKNVRMGFGFSYRVVSDVEFENLTNSDIDGPSATILMKFGKF